MSRSCTVAGWRPSTRLRRRFAGVPKAVLYSFAADPVCEALATAGTALLREPQPDVVVAQWLNSLSAQAATAPQPTADLPDAWGRTRAAAPLGRRGPG